MKTFSSEITGTGNKAKVFLSNERQKYHRLGISYLEKTNFKHESKIKTLSR